MGRREREEIKQLESIKSELSAKLHGLKVQKNTIDREINSTNQNINNLNNKIDKLKERGSLIVSEHAIIRYIERVLGISIDEISQKILGNEIEKQIETLGNGTYPINDNEFKIVIKDNVVVTVIKE